MHVGQRASTDHVGQRRRNRVLAQHFRQKGLVGAAQDGHRVVDDRHSQGRGLLGELKGVVRDGGGLADEKRVKLPQPREILLLDELHGDAHVAAQVDELLERLEVGGRQRIEGVVQHRQIHARQGHGDHRPPAAPRVLQDRLQEHRVARRVDVAQVQGLHVAYLPAARLLAALQRHLHQRAAEQLKALARQRRECRVLDHAEIDMQGEGAHGARYLLERPYQPVELRQGCGMHALALHAEDGVHAGRHALAPGLGKQGAVVAHAQIAVGATKIDDLAPWTAGLGLLGHELVCSDDLERRVLPAEVGQLFHNDQMF